MEEKDVTTVETADDDAPRLLAAIRSNPKAAHVLAEISLGGDAEELLSTLLPPKPEPPKPSQPAFLGYVRDSFWED